MLGIGFWELLLLGVVALLVLGPEHLSTTAKVGGRLFAKSQQMLSSVRDIALDVTHDSISKD